MNPLLASHNNAIRLFARIIPKTTRWVNRVGLDHQMSPLRPFSKRIQLRYAKIEGDWQILRESQLFADLLKAPIVGRAAVEIWWDSVPVWEINSPCFAESLDQVRGDGRSQFEGKVSERANSRSSRKKLTTERKSVRWVLIAERKQKQSLQQISRSHGLRECAEASHNLLPAISLRRGRSCGIRADSSADLGRTVPNWILSSDFLSCAIGTGHTYQLNEWIDDLMYVYIYIYICFFSISLTVKLKGNASFYLIQQKPTIFLF